MKGMVHELFPKRYFMVAVLAFLFSSSSMAEEGFSKLVGSAYSVETGTLLYRETHQKVSEDIYKVEYSEPDGQIFANKTLDFSKSRITPSFSQVNERNGEKISVTQSGDLLKISYQENNTAKVEKDSVKLVAGMVVDAGFDAFVKQYWNTLITGKEMDIEYLVPSRQTTYSFRVSQITCVDGTKEGAMCFALKPVSWFVRLALDPIVVAYDPADKRLLRFTGRANICDEQGKYQTVDIQYHYM
ncbi:hypothetical protein C0J08_19820 [Marinomonas sp. CT5]|uniref:hypothetical protein n=1 Tax=Marinomonas sp. CT5 TaxID=2066133 RepID=UPI001BAEA680|nr:hypothetical protein [Marinomonas sp. CT5]QUX97508.1 hypothetical protein C0J08_19820 [Marinomonas sp. CT5]